MVYLSLEAIIIFRSEPNKPGSWLLPLGGRGGPSTRAAQAMALIAAHVIREQVFSFLAHQAIQHRQPRPGVGQRRQRAARCSLARSLRRREIRESRRGVATAALRPAEPAAYAHRPSAPPPLSGLHAPAPALRGGVASPPPLCAPRRRGRRLLPQPVSLLPAARLLPADPDR